MVFYLMKETLLKINFRDCKSFIGYLTICDVVFETFQLKFWSDEEMYDCVMSGVERQRERSEERR